MIERYRQQLIPVLYTELSFIRGPMKGLRSDGDEDLEAVRVLQRIARGEACVSEIERDDQIIVKMQLPDNILELDGRSNESVVFEFFAWRLWDVECLVTRDQPSCTVHVDETERKRLLAFAKAMSCRPYLKDVKAILNHDGSRTDEQRKEIWAELKLIEDKSMARFRIQKRKGLVSEHGSPNRKRSSSISVRQRKQILERDGNKCVFCGRGRAEEVVLEVDHVIPRSMIDKLELDAGLHVSPKNLATTCKDCNRGKSDNLSRADVDYCLQQFSPTSHPNHDLIEILETIRALQRHGGQQ